MKYAVTTDSPAHEYGVGARSEQLARRFAALLDLGLECVIPQPASESIRLGPSTSKVSQFRPAMGTLVSVCALHSSITQAEEAIGRAFEEMDRLIGLFNRYDEASAISCLNQESVLSGAPPEVCRVLEEALRFHRLSHGAFDVSVKPLVDLFRGCPIDQEPSDPPHRELLAAMSLVGSQQIELSDRDIRFRRPGMGITLDGIAKGYIVDQMAAVLDRQAVNNYLINAGGDIRTSGTKERGQPWTIAVQDPDKRGRFPDVIRVGNGAVATSGSYEIYFDRDRSFHHIVNSKTGRSPARSVSVSVIAPTAIVADALATSVFVMDPTESVRWIETLPGCECLILPREATQVLQSGGWRSVADAAD